MNNSTKVEWIMGDFSFFINGTWEGDRNGTGNIKSDGGLNNVVSAPKDFDGPGIGSNPEELLISSANTCYMITLAAMFSNRKIKVDKLEVISEGVLGKVDGKFTFKQIIHRPAITIGSNENVSLEKLQELAVRAEEKCFISNTLRNSLQFSVEPKIIIT
jgi:peroxiredoxin-like protein